MFPLSHKQKIMKNYVWFAAILAKETPHTPPPLHPQHTTCIHVCIEIDVSVSGCFSPKIIYLPIKKKVR